MRFLFWKHAVTHWTPSVRLPRLIKPQTLAGSWQSSLGRTLVGMTVEFEKLGRIGRMHEIGTRNLVRYEVRYEDGALEERIFNHFSFPRTSCQSQGLAWRPGAVGSGQWAQRLHDKLALCQSFVDAE